MKKVADIAYALIGAALCGIALNMFLLPSGLAPGGVSGLAVILSTLTGGVIPVGVGTALLNIPLFVVGYRVLGRNFTVRSIIGTVLFSIAADTMTFASHFTELSDDFFISSIWGGVLLGAGMGLIFRSGATTGGTDIAARLTRRRLSFLTLGQLVLLYDAAFLVIYAVSQNSPTHALYTGVTVFVSSRVIDAVEGGVNYAKEFYVVSAYCDEIGKAAAGRLARGATIFEGRGAYTGGEHKVLWCVVYNRQVSELRKIINECDPQAFVAIRDVREVSGLYNGKEHN